jgi:hypothetical protein
VTYAAMYILGRMNLRPELPVLSLNSHYPYMALLFALTTGFTLLQGVPNNIGFTASAARKAMFVALVVLTIFGGLRIFSINTRFVDTMKCFSSPIRAIDTFVRKHRHERGFSLAIDYEASDPIPERVSKRITDIVFSRWISSDPKYRVAIHGSKAEIVSVRNAPNALTPQH